MLLFVLVIHVNFGAFLISILSSDKSALPFHSVGDLLKVGYFKFAVEKGTYIENEFEVSLNDTIFVLCNENNRYLNEQKKKS